MKEMNIKNPKAGIYAPMYYRDFQCIADRCRHSCCIDWEICIDEVTYEAYRQMADVSGTIEVCEDGPCFALRADGRCPHLNDAGLCNIILNHGEAYLSEICSNHPRFYNDVGGNRIEVGLGLVCEEACRLILTSDAPFSLSQIEECAGEMEDESRTFDARTLRNQIISLIEGEGGFDGKILALQERFALPALAVPDAWVERLLSLEILDASWARDLEGMRGKLFFKSKKLSDEYGKYYERLLSYFVYRHVSVADCEEALRARLAFAVFSTEVIRSLFEEHAVHTPEVLMDWARRYSAEIEYSVDNTDELIFAFQCRKR